MLVAVGVVVEEEVVVPVFCNVMAQVVNFDENAVLIEQYVKARGKQTLWNVELEQGGMRRVADWKDGNARREKDPIMMMCDL